MIIVNHQDSEIIVDILVMLLILEWIAKIMLVIIINIVDLFMLTLISRITYKWSFYLTRRFILTILEIMRCPRSQLLLLIRVTYECTFDIARRFSLFAMKIIEGWNKELERSFIRATNLNDQFVEEVFEELKYYLITLRHEGVKIVREKEEFPETCMFRVKELLFENIPDREWNNLEDSDLHKLAIYVEQMIDNEYENDKCGNTLCVLKQRFTCSRCKNTSYCSKECSVVYWPRHKRICKALRQIQSEVD